MTKNRDTQGKKSNKFQGKKTLENHTETTQNILNTTIQETKPVKLRTSH